MNPEFPAHHVDEDDLHLYILGRLSVAEVKTLEDHAFQCLECKDRLGAIAQIVARIVTLQRDYRGSDNRSEPRIRASDAGFVRSFSPLLPDRWPVQIIDVSKHGLGLLVPVRLSPGVLVQVQISEMFLLGEVVYSKQIGEHEFRTGIRRQDVLAPRP